MLSEPVKPSIPSQEDQAEPGKGEPPASSEVDKLLTLADAGRMVNRSATTIARWCDEGLIEYVRLPGVTFGRRAVRHSTMLRFMGGTNVLAERGGRVPAARIHQPQGSANNGDS